MKGLIGAATVVGCLQHGAGVCEQQPTGSPLLIALKAESLASSRGDEDFLVALRLSAATETGGFPPAALVEIYQEPGAVAARLRRLHLIIVDLCHPRKVVTKTEKFLYRQMLAARDTWVIGTTPIPLRRNESWRCRYSFGYGLDDSDKPVFLVWPERTEHNGFGLTDVETGNYHDLCETPSIQNLGLEHFYGLGCSRNLRISAAHAVNIGVHLITEDCAVAMDVARQLRPLQHGTPCEAQAKKKAKTTASDVAMQNVTGGEVDSSPSGSDSDGMLHLARRLPARCMRRMLTLILKNFKTIITLPFEPFLMLSGEVALPTDIVRPRNCLRRNGTFREAERA